MIPTQVLRECGIVESYAGPKQASADEMAAPPELVEQLLAESGPPALWASDVAGAVIRAPAGPKVGIVCARALAPRRIKHDAVDALVDIACLAQAELAVRRARQPDELTVKILESMTDAWVFLDRDWRYTYVNKKAGEIFERDPRELVGKHIWTEFPDGIGQLFHRTYEAAMAEQVLKRIEAFYPPWNRWFENRIYPSADGLAIYFQDVTDRRRAEAERRRLASIIENTTDLVAISNAEGGLLFLAPAARAALGVADDTDLLELHIIRLHALDSRELVCDALAQARDNGAWRGEATLLHRSGAKVPASEVILWHSTQEPETGYFSLVARDITEQKRIEEQRKKDAELRAQTERMAHLGHWTWDIASNRVSWSDELHRIFGVEPGSIQVSFDEYLRRIHPRDRERVRETIQAALRDRTACTFKDMIVRPNGELRYLHSWANVGLEDGQPRQMFGICLDMTDVLLTTEDLQQTEEWLGAALRNTQIAVWEWDVQSDELRFSDGAAEALGHGALATTFDEYLRHVHPEDVNAVAEAFGAALDQGSDVDLEHRVRAADKSARWLVVRGCPRKLDGRVERLLGTVVDVTARHHAEEERRTLLQRLKDAQKMEAIGRLAAGVAHDFNNHLTVIQSAAELLLREGILELPFRQLASDIDEAAENAATLTKQLLTFGRQKQHRLHIQPVDLNALVRGTCKLLRHLLPDNVELELELELEPALEPVLSDREQLERVLLNLVVNARDAMPDGGRLTIATRVTDGQAELEVRDSGVGMTWEIQEHIFEPFFTTKDGGNGSGTGLGLATVYGIVTQSGGNIEVSSQPGVGTTFSIRLPLAGAD